MRKTTRILILVLVLLLAGELSARFIAGLGDPPLLMSDSEIEYLFRPNQHCMRFGNEIRYNRYSMRSDDFPPEKKPGELRVLVLGDSVINGGNLTDQKEICTEILRSMLKKTHSGPVTVGNISAGSWGPPNLLAYIRKFGTFHADYAFVVLSSHDFRDAPEFRPFSPAMPTEKPFSALWEGIRRYLLFPLEKKISPPPPSSLSDEARESACLSALERLFGVFEKDGVVSCLFLHWERSELGAPPSEGNDALRRTAEKLGVPFVQLEPLFSEEVRKGGSPYRDNIHPNPRGQKLLAKAMFDYLKKRERAKE